tara:strand:+ start:8610 stop:9362 length:753 start_codon:yes stop_codon:yes gene_type:complete
LNINPKDYQYTDDILNDRIILITGASDGIGRALALSAAALGARVILHGRNTQKLEQVYDDIEKIGSALTPAIAVLDLSVATGDDYAALADSVEDSFGKLDGLLHNAAILGQRLPLDQYDPNEWAQVLHVNLTAPMVLTQVLMPLLRKSADPSVIFTSSGVGRIGRAFWGAYSASKFGIEALSQILAEENTHTGLRANCINPGPVRTNMRLQAYPAENKDKLATPEDITAAYIYLLGPDSKGITGKSFDIS